MTIRTVTLSPGFDHEIVIDNRAPGEVDSVESWTVNAGGKGVNVARFAARIDAASVAYTLVGEDDLDEFTKLIARDGASAVAIPVPGSTRRNLTLSISAEGEPASHATGRRLATATNAHVTELVECLLDEVEHGDLVTLNGAAPTGLDQSIWANTARVLAERGVSVVADVQGEPLLRLLESAPLIAVKPNMDEVRFLVPEVKLTDPLSGATAAMSVLKGFDIDDPIISMGDHGVLHQVDGRLVRSWCPVSSVVRTVGAGDAFIAGYCAALCSDSWAGVEPVSLGLSVAAARVAGLDDEDVGSHVRALLDSITSEHVD